MKFGTFLLALAEPILAKVLLALGFSVITIVGVEASLNTIKGLFTSSMNGLPVDLLNLLQYLWIGRAFGIIFGACAAKLTLWSIQQATSILGKNPT